MAVGVSNLSRPSGVRWWIFILACAASLLLYLHRYAWGAIKPLFRADYPGFSDIDIGWIDSAFLAAYALGQVPAGMAGDRFGPRLVLSSFTLVGSLAMAGVVFVSGFWPLMWARAGFGLAQAATYPVISKVTRTWFPLATRTTVQGVVTAMGRIGGACAPFLILTLLMGEVGLSWQATLMTLLVPGLLLAIGFWIIVRDRPGEHPWVNSAERTLIEDAPPVGAIRAGDAPVTTKPTLEFNRATALSLGMMLLYAFASTFQDQFWVFWLTSFLKEGEQGLTVAQTGIYGSLPFVSAALGGIMGGWLNDWLIGRWGNRRWSRALIAMFGKTAAAGLVLLSVLLADKRETLLVLVAARLFSDWSLPTQWAAVTDMGGRASATLFGLVNTIGALGGFAANPIFGYLKQEHGWPGVFAGVSAMCLAAAATWLFIDCTRKVVED